MNEEIKMDTAQLHCMPSCGTPPPRNAEGPFLTNVRVTAKEHNSRRPQELGTDFVHLVSCIVSLCFNLNHQFVITYQSFHMLRMLSLISHFLGA